MLDLLHLVRSLRRSPASALAAVVTLALTFGTAASVFAVVDAVLLTPPPFAEPESIVIVGETPLDNPTAAPRAIDYGRTLDAWRARAGSLAALEAYDATNLTVTEIGVAERVRATDATPGLLQLLGVTPALGRTFRPDDVGKQVAVISHQFWSSKLGGDPRIIGRDLILGGQPHTVIGVLPERFSFALNMSDVWRPLALTPAESVEQAADARVQVIGRLANAVPPVELADALSEVSGRAVPAANAVVTPVTSAIAGDARTVLVPLAAGAVIAALIAFINLGGLLVVRSLDRQRELAVRSALGARGIEVVVQLLLEAFTLVFLGVVTGALLALWLTPLAARLVTEQFRFIAVEDIGVRWQLLGWMAAAAFVGATLCGLLGAAGAVRRMAVDVLRRGATASPHEVMIRRAFVAGEVALAFVLLVSMTLVGRTLLGMLRVDPGFDASGVLALQVALPRATYPTPDHAIAFYATVQNAIEARLGSDAVSVIDELPLTGSSSGRGRIGLRENDVGREATFRTAGPGYFDVMHIPIVAGLDFGGVPAPGARLQAIISESFAEQFFPAVDPIGRQVWIPERREVADVIGVAGDVMHRALDEAPAPTIYLAALQAPSAGSIFVVRSSFSDADVVGIVRAEVGRLDPNLPIYAVRSLQQIVDRSPGLPARRLLTAALAGFALLAVALSTIGLFGVAAHDVARRRGELAVRIALGAGRGHVVRTAAGPMMMLIAIGLVAGAVLSVWAVPALGALVSAGDRLDVSSALPAMIVLAVTAVAAIAPATIRAMRTDPLTALRSE